MLTVRAAAFRRSGQSGWSSLSGNQKIMFRHNFVRRPYPGNVSCWNAAPSPTVGLSLPLFTPLPLSHLSLSCLGSEWCSDACSQRWAMLGLGSQVIILAVSFSGISSVIIFAKLMEFYHPPSLWLFCFYLILSTRVNTFCHLLTSVFRNWLVSHSQGPCVSIK